MKDYFGLMKEINCDGCGDVIMKVPRNWICVAHITTCEKCKNKKENKK